MGIKSIRADWPNIPLSKEDASKLVRIENNPVYKDVVITYSERSEYDNNPPEPLTFGDICYWLAYEAGYQENEENDHRYSSQAIASIKRWARTNYNYPVDPWGWF